MTTATKYRTTIVMVMALGLLLGALLSTGTPASAATTPGKAYAWGDNTYGQLGDGNAGTDGPLPRAIHNFKGVKSVSAGCNHALALKTDGTVWAWGRNDFGQLGNGTSDPSDVPVQVKKLTDVKAISAGCDHNLALKKDGSVWAWGLGTNGELGNGSRASRNVPVKVASLGTGVRRVAAGYYFSLALMNDGTVRSWGYNYYGQLGDGTYGPNASKATPVAVNNLSGVKALATDSSAEHVLALLDDGTVRAWGYNYYGQLGDGTWLYFRVTPVAVTDLTGVTQVAVGKYHSLALVNSGILRVRAWGYNYYGQLGVAPTSVDRHTPEPVFELTNVRSISAGGYHSLAIGEDGNVRSWGYNSDGQLGNGASGPGSDEDHWTYALDIHDARSIDGGKNFTLATTW